MNYDLVNWQCKLIYKHATIKVFQRIAIFYSKCESFPSRMFCHIQYNMEFTSLATLAYTMNGTPLQLVDHHYILMFMYITSYPGNPQLTASVARPIVY